MSIKIVVDSASDIDQDEANSLGITLIPMEVNFGETSYLDGVNLSHRQFFEKLIETDDFPKTSQINEYRFEEIFRMLISDENQVLCITLSSKLSGTYNSAKSAASKFDGKVKVVDSNNVCIGERLLILHAIKLVKDGLNLDEIVKILNEKKSKIKLLALLNTLKYLKKGGRISSLTAFTGEVLNIKPVISIVDGEVKLIGKAMGSKKGNNLLVQLVEKSGGIDFDMPYAVAYSGLSDEMLKKYLSDSSNLWKDNTSEIPSYMIGSTIGTHAGPGAIAVSFFSKN